MLIKNMILRRAVNKKSCKLVYIINTCNPLRGTLFCYNTKSFKYTVYEYSVDGLKVLDDNLSYPHAKFKYNVLMNRGKSLC